MDAKWLEAWIALNEQALKGAERAREALEALGGKEPSPDQWMRWVSQWFPAASVAPSPPEAAELRKVLEEWWEAVGVVPRYRYQELQRQRDDLEQKLHRAEATIQKLRTLLEEKVVGSEAVGEVAKQQWEQAARTVLDAQQEWARALTEGMFGKEGKGKKKPEK